MTFLINHRGIVFQKDLGPDTETLAPTIETFVPDASGHPTADSVESVDSDEEDADTLPARPPPPSP